MLAPPPAGTIAMTLYQNNYETLGIKLETAFKDDIAEAHVRAIELLLEKEMAIKAPDGFKWGTVKFLFRKEKYSNIWRLKKNVGAGLVSQMLSLQEFFDHQDIQPWIESGIISSVDYYDKPLGGKEILKEEAMEASLSVNPDNRPTASTPGKRARVPDTTTPPSSSGSKTPKTT